MTKGYILPSIAVAAMGFFAFQSTTTDNGIVRNFERSHFKNNGGQSGLTGAPGEQNCTLCHSGSTQDGSVQNIFTLEDALFNQVTSYNAGETYRVTLQLDSDPVKKGFSSVVLDGTDSNAGAFTGELLGGTQDFNAASRDYVSHKSTSTGDSLWFWTWVAPTPSVGDVTFYIASNETNSNNNTSGDVIYLSSHVITDPNASISELNNNTDFSAGYSPSTNKVMVDFTYLAAGDMYFNLIDMNGRSVYVLNLGQSEIGENSEQISLPSDIKSGMYVVHFFVGNMAMSANILVN